MIIIIRLGINVTLAGASQKFISSHKDTILYEGENEYSTVVGQAHVTVLNGIDNKHKHTKHKHKNEQGDIEVGHMDVTIIGRYNCFTTWKYRVVLFNCWFSVVSTEYMRYIDLPNLNGGDILKTTVNTQGHATLDAYWPSPGLNPLQHRPPA